MEIFGILNLTSDSFSDGGRYLDPAAALRHAAALRSDGATHLDLGAASSHPSSQPVAAQIELERLRNLATQLIKSGYARREEISLDCCTTAVQRQLLLEAPECFGWLNDIRGFSDPQLYDELAKNDANLIIMYSRSGSSRAGNELGDPERTYEEASHFLLRRAEELMAAGVVRKRIWIDPGMGYFLGSDPACSLTMLRRLPELCALGYPVLISVSRKSFLGAVTGREIAEREYATLAAELYAVRNGATAIRTHQPGKLLDGLRIEASIRG